MTPRLTTDYAKNICNRTLIVKVIVENVVTYFLWDTVHTRKSKQYRLKNHKAFTSGDIAYCIQLLVTYH